MSHDPLLSDDDIDDRPLTSAERRAVRLLIQREDRIQWFWGTVRVWAGWLSAVAVALMTIIEIGKKLIPPYNN